MGRHHRAALDHKQQLQLPDCVICGQRLGRHRFATDQCPNPRWSPGNGEGNWQNTSYLETSDIRVPEASVWK